MEAARRLGPEDADVALACAGRHDAFDRLVRRHEGAVIGAARKLLSHQDDALDVAQETFLKMYVGLPRFRGGSSLRTWLVQISLNTARSLRTRERARKRCPRRGGVEAMPVPLGERAEQVPDARPDADPCGSLERSELADAVERAIITLDPVSREYLLARTVEDLSYEEIAARHGVPVGTVKSKVHRARARIRELLAPLLV